jgi:hypothetical protein
MHILIMLRPRKGPTNSWAEMLPNRRHWQPSGPSNAPETFCNPLSELIVAAGHEFETSAHLGGIDGGATPNNDNMNVITSLCAYLHKIQ